MTNNESLNELKETLESIRQEKYPEIPRELINELLLNEFEEIDNRSNAQTKCKSILEKFFQNNNKPDIQK